MANARAALGAARRKMGKISRNRQIGMELISTFGDVAAFANTYSLGYTLYTALITQAGTAAPTATVLQNTITGTLTWGYTSPGIYTLTSNGTPFTSNKTIVFLNVGDGEHNQMLMWTRTSSSVITLKTNGANDRITAGALEIRVYS